MRGTNARGAADGTAVVTECPSPHLCNPAAVEDFGRIVAQVAQHPPQPGRVAALLGVIGDDGHPGIPAVARSGGPGVGGGGCRRRALARSVLAYGHRL